MTINACRSAMGWPVKREQKVFTSIYNAYTRKREPQFPKKG
jgi:hypothetical protein